MSAPQVQQPQPLSANLSQVISALQSGAPKLEKSAAGTGPFYAALNADLVNKYGPFYVNAEQGFLRQANPWAYSTLKNQGMVSPATVYAENQPVLSQFASMGNARGNQALAASVLNTEQLRERRVAEAGTEATGLGYSLQPGLTMPISAQGQGFGPFQLSPFLSAQEQQQQLQQNAALANAQNQAGLTGGLIGAGGQVLGSAVGGYFGGPLGAQGGGAAGRYAATNTYNYFGGSKGGMVPQTVRHYQGGGVAGGAWQEPTPIPANEPSPNPGAADAPGFRNPSMGSGIGYFGGTDQNPQYWYNAATGAWGPVGSSTGAGLQYLVDPENLYGAGALPYGTMLSADTQYATGAEGGPSIEISGGGGATGQNYPLGSVTPTDSSAISGSSLGSSPDITSAKGYDYTMTGGLAAPSALPGQAPWAYGQGAGWGLGGGWNVGAASQEASAQGQAFAGNTIGAGIGSGGSAFEGRVPTKLRQRGGMIPGRPMMSGDTDTVPAMLTPGEMVLTKPQQSAVMPRPGKGHMLRADQKSAMKKAKKRAA